MKNWRQEKPPFDPYKYFLKVYFIIYFLMLAVAIFCNI